MRPQAPRKLRRGTAKHSPKYCAYHGLWDLIMIPYCPYFGACRVQPHPSYAVRERSSTCVWSRSLIQNLPPHIFGLERLKYVSPQRLRVSLKPEAFQPCACPKGSSQSLLLHPQKNIRPNPEHKACQALLSFVESFTPGAKVYKT